MNKLTSAVKVLVVDDQPLIVEELCEFLESSGYRCVPSESSRHALQRFSEDAEIGLVLCDLHMPDMDGIELVQAMQKVAGKQRAFESIMLTGRADKQDVIKALRAGISDYYQKPINLDELLEGLQRQEAALEERQKELQLGHLNQRLQYLSESINDLYQDLDKVRRAQPAWPTISSRWPRRPGRWKFRRFSTSCPHASWMLHAWWARARPTTRSPVNWGSPRTR